MFPPFVDFPFFILYYFETERKIDVFRWEIEQKKQTNTKLLFT